MLVKPEEILIEQRYEEEELPFIKALCLGAEAFLYTNDSFKPDNPLTVVVIKLMVGFWLDNRDLNHTEFVKVVNFPLGISSLITSIKYSKFDNVEPKWGEVDEKS